MRKPCVWCRSLEHTPFYCRQKKRTPLKTNKPMNKQGKITKQWLKTRETWFRKNPATKYSCYLRISPYCLRTMTRNETTLDHVIPRSKAPELRYSLDNLRACCYPCNMQKGSKVL